MKYVQVLRFARRARDPGFSVTENFPKVIKGRGDHSQPKMTAK